MSRPPRVSIVIAAYNSGAYLETSVAPALAQTYRDRVVTSVNDGSTDDTAERLRGWNDPALQVITQSNRGYAGALNAGIAASGSEYVGFLDADDVWLPEKLARHVQFLDENPSVDVTFSWARIIDGLGRPMRIPSPRWKGPVSFRQLLTDYTIRTMSAVVMRRSAIEQAGPLDTGFVRCMDIEFFLRIALLRPDNIYAIPEVLTLYRRHPGQHTQDWRLVRKGWVQVLESMRVRAPEDTAAVVDSAESNMRRYFAAIAYENGDFREARAVMKQSFALGPGNFVRDLRNWQVSAACLATLLLPHRALLAIERLGGFDRRPQRR
jgi:glycosyltransferase involved in cell wall biosynthesis